MELWDALDKNGEKLGHTIVRGQPIQPGEYHLVVHIWIRDEKGLYLIQKRADDLEWHPGVWAVTGGSVVAGEDSLTGAIRETQEELGLHLTPEQLHRIDRTVRRSSIVDVWLAQVHSETLGRPRPNNEVSATKWVSKADLLAMISRDEFAAASYLHLLPE